MPRKDKGGGRMKYLESKLSLLQGKYRYTVYDDGLITERGIIYVRTADAIDMDAAADRIDEDLARRYGELEIGNRFYEEFQSNLNWED